MDADNIAIAREVIETLSAEAMTIVLLDTDDDDVAAALDRAEMSLRSAVAELKHAVKLSRGAA